MKNAWHQFLKSQKGKGLNMTQLSNMYRMTGGGLFVGNKAIMDMYPYTLELKDGTELATIKVMYVGDNEFIDYVSENDILTGTEFETVTLMHYMTETHPNITDFEHAELIPVDGEGPEDGNPDIYVVQTKFASEVDARWVYVTDIKK
jgi:hypothetical protein